MANAAKRTNKSDVHVDKLVQFYNALDPAIKENFFRNMMFQLMQSRKTETATPTTGMVTGRDGFKTYSFTTKQPYVVEPVLRQMGIYYVRDILNDKTTMQFVIDIEEESGSVADLSNHPDFQIVLEEITQYPENLHHKLLSNRSYNERNRGSNSRSYNGYERSNYGGKDRYSGFDRNRDRFGNDRYQNKDNYKSARTYERGDRNKSSFLQ